jgi:hypothetical protein
MLAHLHCLGGHHSVVVIGHAHGHRIDAVAHLVEHVAIVVEIVLRLVPLLHAFELCGIDIAQREDLAELGSVLDVALTLASDTNAAKLNLFVERLAVRSTKTAGDPIAGADGRRGL